MGKTKVHGHKGVFQRMSILSFFQTEEEVIAAMKAMIVKGDDGYCIKEAHELNAKLSEVEKHRKDNLSAKIEAEKAVKAKDAEIRQLTDEVNIFKESGGGKEDVLELKKNLAQTTRERDDLKSQNEQINGQVEQFKAKETRQTILDALRTNARELGIANTAERDVERMAGDFKLTELGEIVDADGKSVRQRIEAEIKICPHWMPTSKGSGAAGGTQSPLGGRNDDAVSYDEAKKQGDIRGMIANIPAQAAQQ